MFTSLLVGLQPGKSRPQGGSRPGSIPAPVLVLHSVLAFVVKLATPLNALENCGRKGRRAAGNHSGLVMDGWRAHLLNVTRC